jgi:hypothetical protein
MENYLESAGKSLKSAASDLTSIMFISLGTTILLVITNFMSIPVVSRLILTGLLGLAVSIIILVHYISFVKNLRDTGNSLIMISNRIDIKSSVKVPDSINK